ncbi:hypothetical protein LLG95_06260 [bacterium]|nr:hypothetical protein [bacterium]
MNMATVIRQRENKRMMPSSINIGTLTMLAKHRIDNKKACLQGGQPAHEAARSPSTNQHLHLQ